MRTWVLLDKNFLSLTSILDQEFSPESIRRRLVSSTGSWSGSGSSSHRVADACQSRRRRLLREKPRRLSRQTNIITPRHDLLTWRSQVWRKRTSGIGSRALHNCICRVALAKTWTFYCFPFRVFITRVAIAADPVIRRDRMVRTGSFCWTGG